MQQIFEHDMIEAQDDLNAFKAAHLPIEGYWDEIFIEYGDGSHPPTFEHAREPLDADHWLRQTESKFSLLECTERQKRKFQEFMDLKQGGRNVLQYSEAFNHLAQYATEYVNTEEKKRYTFLRGMNATLKERLTWQTTGTYNDLINAAIVQEGAMRQVEEEDRKRKSPATASAAPQNSQYRALYQQQGNPSARAPLPADRGGNYPCHNCDRTGHFAKNCTAPRRNNNSNNKQCQNQSRNVNALSRGAQVNYTNAEDIPQGEPMLTDRRCLDVFLGCSSPPPLNPKPSHGEHYPLAPPEPSRRDADGRLVSVKLQEKTKSKLVPPTAPVTPPKTPLPPPLNVGNLPVRIRHCAPHPSLRLDVRITAKLPRRVSGERRLRL
ncbi:hypothetical protein PR202_gn00425 [Eleusine coracana subsp. coracana]|uniref:CCHC-type domain-containing protein n=1 Tax=Eleusine coracana subsp. coracana TaxID=191504 RepID=A0AAV5FZJ5_ELECO|nr:hypothetical protein PR202_gn00425 [Eleusine coracana subsp. coracana]